MGLRRLVRVLLKGVHLSLVRRRVRCPRRRHGHSMLAVWQWEDRFARRIYGAVVRDVIGCRYVLSVSLFDG